MQQRDQSTDGSTGPLCSAGNDEAHIVQAVQQLSGRWTLTEDRKGLRRDFKFKTFKVTWVSQPFCCI